MTLRVTARTNPALVPEIEPVLIVIRAWKDEGSVKIRVVTSYPGGSTTFTTTSPDSAITRIKAALDGVD